MTVKIIWVNEEYEGPMNGVCEFRGEKIWFMRFNTPSIISSDIIVNRQEEQDDRLYQLYKLDNQSMETLEENHKKYCEETGAPLFHGDARKIFRDRQKKQIKFSHNLPKLYVPCLRVQSNVVA